MNTIRDFKKFNAHLVRLIVLCTPVVLTCVLVIFNGLGYFFKEGPISFLFMLVSSVIIPLAYLFFSLIRRHYNTVAGIQLGFTILFFLQHAAINQFTLVHLILCSLQLLILCSVAWPLVVAIGTYSFLVFFTTILVVLLGNINELLPVNNYYKINPWLFAFLLSISGLIGLLRKVIIYIFYTEEAIQQPPTTISVDNGFSSSSSYTLDFESLLNSIAQPAMLVNPLTGLSIAANGECVSFLNAPDANALIAIDFAQLFVKGGVPEFVVIKEQLIQKGYVQYLSALNSGNDQNQVSLSITKFNIDHHSLLLLTFADTHVQPSTLPIDHDTSITDLPFFMIIKLNDALKISDLNHAALTTLQHDIMAIRHQLFSFIIDSSDVSKIEHAMATLNQGAAFIRIETKFINSSKQYFHVMLTALKYENGFLWLAENIHARKRYEELLVAENNRFKSMVEQNVFAMMFIDRGHQILAINQYFNAAVHAVTGLYFQPGYQLLPLVPANLKDAYQFGFEKALGGEIHLLEYDFPGNATAKIFKVAFAPAIDRNGNVQGVLLSAVDITADKEHLKRIESERDLAIKATEAKGAFLATMSHEIRTPLNGVIGMGKLLANTALSQQQKEYVDAILLSGDALLSVINDILDYSKIESAKMELEYRAFSIKRCIEESFSLLSSKALEKNLQLKMKISSDVPTAVLGDVTRLRQVLLNLLSNAIKFTLKGSITIEVNSESDSGGHHILKFEVKDTGMGIPPEKIDKLFRNFSQADPGTARSFGGTGLGLAISKSLVELMGGSIGVSSVPGVGSTFTFYIKAGEASINELNQSASNLVADFSNLKVLIFSDDKINNEQLGVYFRKWNINYQIAEQLTDAIALVQQDDYHLIMLNAQLINTDALQAGKIIGKQLLGNTQLLLFNADADTLSHKEFDTNLFKHHIPIGADRSKLLDTILNTLAETNVMQNNASVDSSILASQYPLNILVVDDNEINRKLAVGIFASLGYTVALAVDGREAINKVRRNSYDIIFMDVQMPELNGLEATHFIKDQLQPTPVPIIVAMTAFALEGDKERCLAAGMNDYISKPIMVEDIVSIIRKWSTKNKDTMIKNSNTTAIQVNSNTIIDVAILNRLKEMNQKLDPSFLRDVVLMYLAQAPKLIDEITIHYQNGQAELAGAVAHKLKGSSLQLGAMALADVAKQIERMGRDKQLVGMEPLILKMVEVYKSTDQYLKAEIA
ncbi:MAG: hypothetical protein RIQ89_1891 [Bacteroidota bacterium]